MQNGSLSVLPECVCVCARCLMYLPRVREVCARLLRPCRCLFYAAEGGEADRWGTNEFRSILSRRSEGETESKARGVSRHGGGGGRGGEREGVMEVCSGRLEKDHRSLGALGSDEWLRQGLIRGFNLISVPRKHFFTRRRKKTKKKRKNAASQAFICNCISVLSPLRIG